MPGSIEIKGARVHNLQNIDLSLPREKLVVITGLSGSGKSSLAFDTLYAEGQRRYVESLSAYARQFLGLMEKPDVDSIEGLSPAISIDQKSTSHNPRSTVGTVTEIYDYLRLLFGRVGHPHCPQCGRPIESQTVQQIVDQLVALGEGARLLILAPLVRGRKGGQQKLFEKLRRDGYVRVRVDGTVYELDEVPELEKNQKHDVEVVVDRIIIHPDTTARLTDSVETALGLADGRVIAAIPEGSDLLFSTNFACPVCNLSIEELSPRLFSFNAPYGACPECSGLGVKIEVDPDLVVPDPTRTLAEGAIAPWTESASGYYHQMLLAFCEQYDLPLDRPWEELPQQTRDMLLWGKGSPHFLFTYAGEFGPRKHPRMTFEGVIPNLERRYRETLSDAVKRYVENYMSTKPCPSCHGKRLKPEVLAVTVGERSIADVTEMTIGQALHFFTEELVLSEREYAIAHMVLKEIRERLRFLVDVGLDYLTLARSAISLSGGEAQRIRLATQIGSALTGVLYILDEPSIGLHERDNAKLIGTLLRLRDMGNTVIVVEHDEETMRASDFMVDVGPGAGARGGRIVAAGTPAEIMVNEKSLTGQYLSGRRRVPQPQERRQPQERWLTIRGAREHNLRNIDVSIPLGLLVCITGVSGSGKSTLVHDILYKRLAHDLNRAHTVPGEHAGLEGEDYLEKVINVDQSPIGRTPRSNPATYTGVFDDIRTLFAQTTDAKVRGYNKGRFSFNVRGGRCEACQGDGILKIEMNFLPDVYVTCEVCKGKRYNRDTLEVHYKGKSIADVLEMTVEEALAFFTHIPRIRRKLQTLYDVGLGYIHLGQPATTLSGGEAQRVKLATELSRRSEGKTLYILDEPTTGLHMEDVRMLLNVLHRLVDAGNTVVVIEHNMDVIKNADYLIDLGPEGGDRGGTVVACGTPEAVAAVAESYTGQFLQKYLDSVSATVAIQAG
ncbi:MAG: excinuclease ABC subunit UvrA [Firmicutes bacterium]|nr:excinuclease ABC subunit UvrA [Bacillota bacterium]